MTSKHSRRFGARDAAALVLLALCLCAAPKVEGQTAGAAPAAAQGVERLSLPGRD